MVSGVGTSEAAIFIPKRAPFERTFSSGSSRYTVSEFVRMPPEKTRDLGEVEVLHLAQAAALKASENQPEDPLLLAIRSRWAACKSAFKRIFRRKSAV